MFSCFLGRCKFIDDIGLCTIDSKLCDYCATSYSCHAEDIVHEKYGLSGECRDLCCYYNSCDGVK